LDLGEIWTKLKRNLVKSVRFGQNQNLASLRLCY